MPKNIPIRMCSVCRSRLEQSKMLRLQCRDGTLYAYSNTGRSFYICPECFDLKKTPITLMRECKCGDRERLLVELKEIIIDVRQS